MGIQNINVLLKKKCPHIFYDRKFEDFIGWKIAVDISIILYKYIKSVGEDNFMDMLIKFLCLLKKYRIKVICIFDGPNPPIEKKQEQTKRRAVTQELEKKLEDIQNLKTLIEVQYKDSQLKIPLNLQKNIREVSGRARRYKPENDGVNYASADAVLDLLERREKTLTNQIAPIKQKHFDQLKEFLDIMGIAHITADGEAEALCAYLAKEGRVDAVMSEDTDVMVYGAPIFLSKIEPKTESVVMVKYTNVLNGLEMDARMFRDLCIFARCDYNKHTKPVTMKSQKGKDMSIGIVRAYNLIKKYNDFETIEAKRSDIDLSPLHWKRCREIFETPPVDLRQRIVPYIGDVKPEQLYLFLRKVDSRISQDYIEELWKPVEMIFEN